MTCKGILPTMLLAGHRAISDQKMSRSDGHHVAHEILCFWQCLLVPSLAQHSHRGSCQHITSVGIHVTWYESQRVKVAFVTAAKLNTACMSCKSHWPSHYPSSRLTQLLLVLPESSPFNLLIVFHFYYLEVWETIPFMQVIHWLPKITRFVSSFSLGSHIIFQWYLTLPDILMGLPGSSVVKKLPAMQKTQEP